MGRRRRRNGNAHRGPTRGSSRENPTGILKVNRRGYGFVTTPEGDWFVPAKYLHGAMDGDRVSVVANAGGRGSRRSARVSHVLVRAHDTLIGTYERNGGLGVIIPYDPRIRFDIFTDVSSYPDARDGDIVSVKITTYPSRHGSATGLITGVVGQADDPDIAERILIARNDVETVFSTGAETEAAAATLDIASALQEPDRRDIRDRFVFTIDPVDARDFDDAISVERLEGGALRLGVHIADVSSYVPWNSSVDLDARRRGTSIYLPDCVIPMLPERLSNELCSLQPRCDRLAFTVDMEIDCSGNLKGSDIYPSIISSDARFDYEQVQRFFDDEDGLPVPEAQEPLMDLLDIARMRYEQRIADGAIDFDSAEPKVRFAEDGSVEDIYLRKRTQATGAIEEAMIAANEVVASYMESHLAPMVYRIHEAPSRDAIAALLPLLKELDYPTEGLMQLNPHAIQAVLARAENRPERDLVVMRVLRSMKRAVYRKDNVGHYGLASEAYTHFTSPIRRYPDLLVHRLLRATLAGFFDGKGEYSPQKVRSSALRNAKTLGGIRAMVDELDWLCEHSSTMERVAAEMEDDAVQIKLCEYMERFIDETFSGIVTSVSSAGLYVTLPTTVKGLVRIQTLGEEYFVYDAEHQTLTGEQTDRVFSIGEQVEVVLKAVSIRDLTIDFELA